MIRANRFLLGAPTALATIRQRHRGLRDKRGTALLEEYKDLTNPIDTHVLPIAPEFEFTIDTGNKTTLLPYEAHAGLRLTRTGSKGTLRRSARQRLHPAVQIAMASRYTSSANRMEKNPSYRRLSRLELNYGAENIRSR